MANTIITTNSDWMVAVSKDDRRYNIRRCKNITPEEKETKFNKEYYKRVAQTEKAGYVINDNEGIRYFEVDYNKVAEN